MIANHKLLDIAKFTANNTAKQSTYLGMFLGYGPLLIGNLCQLTLGRSNSILFASVAEGLLKTWIDMSKISKQMGN
jgi:hypothetical protein